MFAPFASPFPSPFPKNPYGGVTAPVPAPASRSSSSVKRYLNYRADIGGCYYYRMGFAEAHINASGLGESVSLAKMIFDKNWYRDIQVVKLQRQASTPQRQFAEWLKSIQSECGFKMMYEIDDVIFAEDIPDYNSYKSGFTESGVRENCVSIINMVDEVTVTCKYMRDLYRERTGKQEISVVPNFMPYGWIGHQYDQKRIFALHERHKKRPRIVYAGSGAHFDLLNKNNQLDDFTHVIKFVVDNRHKYQFVFIGAYPPPLKQYVDNGDIEYHGWRSLIEYPDFLNSLEPQLFVAPLLDNSFNRSKSDIKFVEAAMLGIPSLCQRLCTYDVAPDELLFGDGDELADKVDFLLNWKNRSRYYHLVPQLRAFGETRFIERPENIGGYMEVMDTHFGGFRPISKRWN